MVEFEDSQEYVLEWLPDVETILRVLQSSESLVEDVVEEALSSVGSDEFGFLIFFYFFVLLKIFLKFFFLAILCYFSPFFRNSIELFYGFLPIVDGD